MFPFLNENVARKLPKKSKFRVGRSNVDSGIGTDERNANLPWPTNPALTWVYYDCAVGVMLDSGIVVHNRLPQVDGAYDTLATCDYNDPNLDSISGFGINLTCKDQFTDIVQRMGHARYWFRLWGQALRIGIQVPIPQLKMIAGVPAIPYDKNPQWAYNTIAPGGNYGGVILWRAQWSLWYTTLVPPRGGTQPPVDPAAYLAEGINPDKGVQAPYSQPDDNAQPNAPGGVTLGQNIISGR